MILILYFFLLLCPARSRGESCLSLEDNPPSTMSVTDARLEIKRLTACLIAQPGNQDLKARIQQLSSMAGNEAPSDGVSMNKEERNKLVSLAYRSLSKTSPDIIKNMLLLGKEYEKKNQYFLAYYAYIKVLDLPGLDLETKYGVEKKLRRAGDLLNIRILRMPEYTRRLYREAVAQMGVGELKESVELLQNLSQIYTKDPEVNEFLSYPQSQQILKVKNLLENGGNLLQANEDEKARKIFEEVLSIDPDSQEAWDGLETIRKNSETVQKKQAISQEISKAIALMRSNKLKALDLLVDALKEDPENQEILTLIKRIEEAVGSKKAVAYVPPSPVTAETKTEPKKRIPVVRDHGKAEVHYQRGLVYYGLRNLREALAEWQIAVKYDPSYQKAARALERVQEDLEVRK